MVVLPPLLEGVPGVEPPSELRVLPGQVVNVREPDIGRDSMCLLLIAHPRATNGLQPFFHI